MARFIPEINAICRSLKKDIGTRSLWAVKDREEQVAAFQNDPEVQVFVGQIATAGLYDVHRRQHHGVYSLTTA